MIGDFYVIFDVLFGDFLVGTGEPPPYCAKFSTKLPFCMGVVLVLKVGIGSTTSPPCCDKIQTLTESDFAWLPILWHVNLHIDKNSSNVMKKN